MNTYSNPHLLLPEVLHIRSDLEQPAREGAEFASQE